MHSSGISELRIRDVLTRVLPQRGHFIRSRSSEPESLFQLGLVSPGCFHCGSGNTNVGFAGNVKGSVPGYAGIAS